MRSGDTAARIVSELSYVANERSMRDDTSVDIFFYKMKCVATSNESYTLNQHAVDAAR